MPTWVVLQLSLPPRGHRQAWSAHHVVCATPLTENMPSGKATKPGDIIIARNGLSIEVDNTMPKAVSSSRRPHLRLETYSLTRSLTSPRSPAPA